MLSDNFPYNYHPPQAHQGERDVRGGGGGQGALLQAGGRRLLLPPADQPEDELQGRTGW